MDFKLKKFKQYSNLIIILIYLIFYYNKYTVKIFRSQNCQQGEFYQVYYDLIKKLLFQDFPVDQFALKNHSLCLRTFQQ
ncbi:unnamed protein product [Paramecium sonneborni]|uniref:Transmembrane protein n=1 Tax=Paramecium sonneborni TaxID=65129 RepID=A0A8S1R1D5_9CILI|nr:unnamed protein product [Paramecium sonneborni]